jgi:uncharacterized membrane protein
MSMQQASGFIVKALLAGAIVVVPIYLAVLLLLKLAGSLLSVVRPIAALLPDSLPAENALSILLVLIVCFLVGVVVRTSIGHAMWQGIERTLFQRIPGYALLKSLSLRVADDGEGSSWKPALVEIEEALVPGFIIEELDDGQFTVFVPSVPTPLAGAVYILARERVHPLDVPFTHVLRTISKWGSGSQDLVAAMNAGKPAPISNATHA